MSPFGDRFAQSPSQTGHTPLDVSGFPFVIDISRLAISDFPETLGTYDKGFPLHMKHLFTPFRCAFQLFHATGMINLTGITLRAAEFTYARVKPLLLRQLLRVERCKLPRVMVDHHLSGFT